MSYLIKVLGKNGLEDSYQLTDYERAIEFAENLSINNAEVCVENFSNNELLWHSFDTGRLKFFQGITPNEWDELSENGEEWEAFPSVYFDIDGTLGKWYKDGKGLTLEEIIDPANHYFRDIEPHDAMISLAEKLHAEGIDVCVISSAYKDTIRDKFEWIKENLPFLPEENIYFAPIGSDKSRFVKGNAEISILIDDYNKNLEEWRGVSVKAINTVNSHQNKFKEIDFTEIEKQSTEKEFNDKVGEAFSEICSEIDRLSDYAEYRTEWEKNLSMYSYIDTEEKYCHYLKHDAEKDISFREYVETFGFSNGTKYDSYEKFLKGQEKLSEKEFER